ncbi:MAG: hypothetical protein QNJ00_17500 [Woeseiaceae bacterium]|nr:hypothetical protein [Woeseiaceae bacterium]
MQFSQFVGGICLKLSAILVVAWLFHLADGIAMVLDNPALSGSSALITIAAMLAICLAASARLVYRARQSFLVLTRED